MTVCYSFARISHNTFPLQTQDFFLMHTSVKLDEYLFLFLEKKKTFNQIFF